ncbi:hypothetical protein GCM10010174_08840 [Kutzneria viridogrisea]|uniref:Cardiolipin synthase N-terminal domain-containing protein n=2 Tax=Kutzneria TaxID=43356 RepID=W5WJX9_9PSEU|nr:PLD nuclease N-terminal domain-containing protein [Kutzneria albida]AHI01514.1 hypothetical protein KALB_8156 [Kutzneria albida DSM 43870]MBA8931477.1 hypothetical protein [Kutzneria viridogrisea]
MQLAAVQFSQVLQALGAIGLGCLAIAHVLIAVLALSGILRSAQGPGAKLVWSLLVCAVPLVGSVLWFLVGRQEQRAQWQQV